MPEPSEDLTLDGTAVQPAEPTAEALGIELPDDPEEAIEVLLEEVAKAREEAAGFLDDLKRVAADFDNYRKRTAKESATVLDRAAERVVERILPVLDTFDAAVKVDTKTEGEKGILAGMINTREQLLKALAEEGLEVIPTVGEPFDPNLHEPVGAPEGSSKLVVAEELRRGYRLRGRVIRAALVVLDSAE
ncbi:MAG TPA: nucleotide exchange factor GrpE [Acidimicrobiia bacterium]